jgi:hypothetical protein
MQNKSRYRLIVSLFLIWPLLTGCYASIGRWGPPFYSGDDEHYFERLIDDRSHEARQDSHFTYGLASDSDLRIVDADPQEKTEALSAPLLLRFAWFSDVHIRQADVKLFSKSISRTMDQVIPTFEHNAVQEDFHWAVYLSQIEAVNRLHRVYPLDFMIQTGDGIDSGTIQELYQFIYISDKLQIPWLNLVGNHDVSIFGNYQEQFNYTQKAGVNFYPVGDLTYFVWMHRKQRVISGFGWHLLPTPSEGGHSPSEDTSPGKKLPPTYHHGFDLTPGQTCSYFPPSNLAYDKVKGYYAADLCAIATPVRLTALNSAKMDEWGADARITPEQRNWLQTTLLSSDGAINLLFVHHRPEDFDAETQALLLSPDHGSLVMFTGHAAPASSQAANRAEWTRLLRTEYGFCPRIPTDRPRHRTAWHCRRQGLAGFSCVVEQSYGGSRTASGVRDQSGSQGMYGSARRQTRNPGRRGSLW